MRRKLRLFFQQLGSAVKKATKAGWGRIKRNLRAEIVELKAGWNKIKKNIWDFLKRYRSVVNLIILLLVGWLLLGWWIAPVSVGTFLFILLVLAPLGIDFTIVEERNARAVGRGGQFLGLLITWADYTFRKTEEGRQPKEAANWEVVEGNEPFHLFGGLRMYSWKWPLERIISYDQEWDHLHEDGTVHHHKGEGMTHILLSLDLYAIRYLLEDKKPAEDINGVPIGVDVILPMR